MLQLPENAPRAHRFTKAQIADMARGAKVTVRVKRPRPKADPIISMIAKADEALEAYILAFNSYTEAHESLPQEDRGWPWVTPIDALIPTLSHSDRFHSEEQIAKQFAKWRQNARAEIKNTRASLRKRRHHEQIRREMLQSIEACQKRIELLTKFEEPQKKAFRIEARRLAKAQRTVLLVEKRKARTEAATALRSLTNKIGKMHPTSKWGSHALLAYVELRCRDDLASYFAENGFYPANLGKLINRASTFLAKEK